MVLSDFVLGLPTACETYILIDAHRNPSKVLKPSKEILVSKVQNFHIRIAKISRLYKVVVFCTSKNRIALRTGGESRSGLTVEGARQF